MVIAVPWGVAVDAIGFESLLEDNMVVLKNPVQLDQCEGSCLPKRTL
jgi:hypothetical protein